MTTHEQQKKEIKRLIKNGGFDKLVMIVGVFETELTYNSIYEFGNRVLQAHSLGHDVIYKKLEYNKIYFRQIKPFKKLTEAEARGYGKGKYQGD